MTIRTKPSQPNKKKNLPNIISPKKHSDTNIDQLSSDEDNNNKKAFGKLGIKPSLSAALAKKNIHVPTPIQRQAIPYILKKSDCMIVSRTGSGKTLSYLIPVFQLLGDHNNIVGARSFILAPSRELAVQIGKVSFWIARATKLRSALLCGGRSLAYDYDALLLNPDILIATPARLLQHIVNGHVGTERCQILALDEADRLLENAEENEKNSRQGAVVLQEILQKIPKTRQTLYISATMPDKISSLLRLEMINLKLIQPQKIALSENLTLVFIAVQRSNIPSAVLNLCAHAAQSHQRILIFTPSSTHVEYYAALLDTAGIRSCRLYSKMDQVARDYQLRCFTRGDSWVALATDIAARGLDIPAVAYIVNVNVPPPKLFVHRVGRTARQSAFGIAITFVQKNDLPSIAYLAEYIGRPLACPPHFESNPQNLVISPISQLIPNLSSASTMGKNPLKLQFAKGSSHFAKGSSQFAKGSSQFAEGSSQFAEGSSQFAEGSSQFAEGSSHFAEGSLQSAEGSLQSAKGSSHFAEGSLQFADGSFVHSYDLAHLSDRLKQELNSAEESYRQAMAPPPRRAFVEAKNWIDAHGGWAQVVNPIFPSSGSTAAACAAPEHSDSTKQSHAIPESSWLYRLRHFNRAAPVPQNSTLTPTDKIRFLPDMPSVKKNHDQIDLIWTPSAEDQAEMPPSPLEAALASSSAMLVDTVSDLKQVAHKKNKSNDVTQLIMRSKANGHQVTPQIAPTDALQYKRWAGRVKAKLPSCGNTELDQNQVHRVQKVRETFHKTRQDFNKQVARTRNLKNIIHEIFRI